MTDSHRVKLPHPLGEAYTTAKAVEMVSPQGQGHGPSEVPSKPIGCLLASTTQ
jgi:hypothetical protein